MTCIDHLIIYAPLLASRQRIHKVIDGAITISQYEAQYPHRMKRTRYQHQDGTLPSGVKSNRPEVEGDGLS